MIFEQIPNLHITGAQTFTEFQYVLLLLVHLTLSATVSQ